MLQPRACSWVPFSRGNIRVHIQNPLNRLCAVPRASTPPPPPFAVGVPDSGRGPRREGRRGPLEAPVAAYDRRDLAGKRQEGPVCFATPTKAWTAAPPPPLPQGGGGGEQKLWAVPPDALCCGFVGPHLRRRWTAGACAWHCVPHVPFIGPQLVSVRTGLAGTH